MRTAMRQMHGVFAQLERGMIRKRLIDGWIPRSEAAPLPRPELAPTSVRAPLAVGSPCRLEVGPLRTGVESATIRGRLEPENRGQLRARKPNGRTSKAARGSYAHGTPRFGYYATGGSTSETKQLAEEEHEQRWLAEMRTWRQGGASYREIEERLNAEGVTSKRGGAWYPSSVCEQLDDEARRANNAYNAQWPTKRSEVAKRRRSARLVGEDTA